MLRFFRNIRQKLIEQENIRKYFFYAIGEIFLVVIGILIALQINNWNEHRKDRVFEHRMLTELKISLGSDINNFRFFERIISDWEKSILYLADASNVEDKSTLDIDSVRYHLDDVWGFGVYVAYNTGPYEALKSSGLDKISNDSLRNEIAKLYSFTLPSLDIWVNEIIRGSITEKFELFDLLFDVQVTRDGQDLNKELIVEDLLFLDSPVFSDILNKSSNTTNSTKTPLAQNRIRMEELLAMIEKEIDHQLK